MQIFVTLNGLNCIAGGYVIVALAFYDSIPHSLLSLLQSSKLTVNDSSLYERILNYSDSFYFESDITLLYTDLLTQSINIRNTAQRLALSLNYKILDYSPTEYIYYKNLPKPVDFNVTYYNKLSSSFELFIAHIIAYNLRSPNLALIEYQNPKFKFTQHRGAKTATHFEEIIKHGLTTYHRNDTLNLTAKYIQNGILKHADSHMLKHQKLFKQLPIWWQRADPSKLTLKDYFTEAELDEIKDGLRWCRTHKRLKDSKCKLFLPQQKQLPYKFTHWLNNN